jgi:hypothetical protein
MVCQVVLSLSTSLFCAIEMLFEGSGKPGDYRFLEANPAFHKHKEIEQPVVDKTVFEFVPALEQFWLELYGKVAQTGKPVGLENAVLHREIKERMRMEGKGKSWTGNGASMVFVCRYLA